MSGVKGGQAQRFKNGTFFRYWSATPAMPADFDEKLLKADLTVAYIGFLPDMELNFGHVSLHRGGISVSSFDTIIVGAGIAGLTAAIRLQRAGQRVVVLEADERPGGRITRIVRSNGDRAEAGAQGLHSNYTEMLGIIADYGMTADIMQTGRKLQYLDRRGRPRLSGSNVDLARIIGLRGSLDLARFWTQYFTYAKPFSQFELNTDIPEYDNISASDELSWAGRNFTDFVLRPMSWAMANSTPDKISMYYIVNGLRLRMTTRILGLRRGIASLPERMAQDVPVEYGKRVQSVLTTAGAVDGVLLDDGKALKANHVILACTAGGAGSILTDEFEEERRFLTSFNHTPMPLVFFFLDRPVRSEAYAYMGHAFRDATFNMAVNHAAKTPYLVPSGKALISAWPAFPKVIDLFGRPDAELIELAKKDLGDFFPEFPASIEEARVVRHHWGLARYEPGMHRKVLDFKSAAERLRGVSFAGTDYDSIHMESGIRSGQRAANRALHRV
ncbi:NAD(P)/FAD-dependent oxidoreductase [Mesorhizobium sp.]|uniref:protoporphyrinogen/coproporphyrinogen oxidase n=1 Tax=Mesorhizobium sp. TaxID=1871066 RepID=UPI000FEA6717|nr:NAD(P)/FAD-dependent oxidoreductase [Mesorhizobium sp.]RWJ05712.1 MAG: NAD(P)/FAD-dependent oxidoreductase [Mesorhizobium sp.]